MVSPVESTSRKIFEIAGMWNMASESVHVITWAFGVVTIKLGDNLRRSREITF